MIGAIKLNKVHLDHSLWKNELDFLLEEIKIFEDAIIVEISNTLDDEEFFDLLMNFITQRGAIKRTKRLIDSNLQELDSMSKANGNLKTFIQKEYSKSLESMNEVRNGIKELKDQLENRFIV